MSQGSNYLEYEYIVIINIIDFQALKYYVNLINAYVN
jgi:hypothetical protein